VATDSPVRVALVTGASAGIGRAIAVALGALGWKVASAARRFDACEATAKLVDDAGGTGLAVALDLTDTTSIDACIERITAEAGPIDVLVNNASVAVPGATYELSDEDQRGTLETNLVGTVLLTKRIVKSWVDAATTGDVVFMTSDSVVQPRPHLGTYMASKAGVETFARVLALELEGTGIRSSIVRVGQTGGTSFGDAWDPDIFETLIPYWQRFGAQRHWGMLEPEDVARAVVHVVTAPPGAHLAEVAVEPVPPAS
jgi:NAD(P)-dependent dehydrogenase (short-subunit alcohol dehydrogenase family)